MPAEPASPRRLPLPGIRTACAALATAVVILVAGRAPLYAGGNACAIWQSAPLSFGAYDPLGAVPTDAVGSMDVLCLLPVSTLEFALDSLQSDGSRRIYNGADFLTYNIYSDAARVQVIGSGSNGTRTYRRSGLGMFSSTPLYGRIPAGQDVVSGTYTDTVVVTINF